MKTNKTGLALGGGAVLGAAHLGVLKAVEEADLKVTHIAGTSIGAFVAAFYAFGMKWKEILAIASELKWMDITKLSLSRYGLLSNEKFGALIREYLGDKNLEDAAIPLAMVATNAANGQKVVLTKGSVAKAVMASTCIPGIFEPVEMNGMLLLDGGIVENVPIKTLKDMGADFTIGVDLNAKHTYEKPDNILEVIVNSFHFIMRQSVALQTREADLMITPDLAAFNRANINRVDELLQKGYEAAKEPLIKGLEGRI